MTTVREQAIEAGARALHPYGDGLPTLSEQRAAAAVVDAVEPLIRADEQRLMADREARLDRMLDRIEARQENNEAEVRERIAQEIEAMPLDGREGPRGRVIFVRDVRSQAYRDAARIARGVTP